MTKGEIPYCYIWLSVCRKDLAALGAYDMTSSETFSFPHSQQSHNVAEVVSSST